jgi:glutathione S-transferase
MKLYFSPGACSLTPHIVLRETGAKFEIEQVDNKAKKTKSGADYWQINPKGQVPALVLDNGEVLTEGPVISQYIADNNPGAGLLPACGTPERYRVQEWQNFITSEIHKSFGPLFKPNTPEEFKTITKENLGKHFSYVDKHLAKHQYLAGDKFSIADAYLYNVSRWLGRVGIDIGQWPNVKAFGDRIAARPKVQEALKAEGLS